MKSKPPNADLRGSGKGGAAIGCGGSTKEARAPRKLHAERRPRGMQAHSPARRRTRSSQPASQPAHSTSTPPNQAQQAYLARSCRMVATMSSVFRAMCCSPGPSFCSRKVWIWLLLQGGHRGEGGAGSKQMVRPGRGQVLCCSCRQAGRGSRQPARTYTCPCRRSSGRRCCKIRS